MNKRIVELLPKVQKNLFLKAIPVGALFLLFWYKGGGMDLYANWLTFLIRLIPGTLPISYEDTNFLGLVRLVSGKEAHVGFKANGLNLSLATVVTLFAMIPHTNFKKSLRLAGWLLLITSLWHIFEISLHLHHATIGKDFANAQKIFWDPTPWYEFVHWVTNFDKLVLKYWMGLILFVVGLLLNQIRFGKAKKKKS